MYINPDGSIVLEDEDFGHEGEGIVQFAFTACEAVYMVYAPWEPNGVGVHFHEIQFKPGYGLARKRLDPETDEDIIDLVDRLDYECYLEVYGKETADRMYPRFQQMWDEWNRERVGVLPGKGA